MTGFTKSHQIALFIAAALGKREDVVDLLGRRQLALLLALLTEGMQLDVTVTDALPASAVAFVGLGVAFVLVVLFVNDLLVFGAVLLTHAKPTAAGVGAGTLGFVWHLFTSLGTRKALRDCSHKALLDSIFLIIMLSGVACVFQCLFVSTSQGAGILQSSSARV